MFGNDFSPPAHPGVPGERVWICRICGWLLDERTGDPDAGIAPGTPVENYPPDWTCPECGAGFGEFEPFLEQV